MSRRAEDDDASLLTERDQAAIDAIRREIDREYGVLDDDGLRQHRDPQPARGQARRLLALVLVIGGLVAAGAAVYLKRPPEPTARHHQGPRPSDPERGQSRATSEAVSAPSAPGPVPNRDAPGIHDPPALPTRPERTPELRAPVLPREVQLPPRAPREIPAPPSGPVVSLPERLPSGPSSSPGPALTPPAQSHASLALSAPVPAARGSAGPGMTWYSDPRGAFMVAHPVGWHVRPLARGPVTAFFVDDPDEGIALTVEARGTVSGHVEGAALASIVTRHMKQRYPDFTFIAVSSRRLASSAQQSDFTAQWTNRWAQQMRATGRIVSVPRDGVTRFSYVAGQAQELAYHGLDPIFQRMLESFQEEPSG